MFYMLFYKMPSLACLGIKPDVFLTCNHQERRNIFHSDCFCEADVYLLYIVQGGLHSFDTHHPLSNTAK